MAAVTMQMQSAVHPWEAPAQQYQQQQHEDTQQQQQQQQQYTVPTTTDTTTTTTYVGPQDAPAYNLKLAYEYATSALVNEQRAQAALRQYVGIKELGWGRYGTVSLARDLITNSTVAIKTIHKTGRTPPRQSEWIEQVLLSRFSHQNIIHLFNTIETEDSVNLVLEYAPGGDLLNYVKGHGRLQESVARDIMGQLIHGLAYAHALGVVHRDMKLENILLSEGGRILIADWGLATFWAPTEKRLISKCGSKHYMAPEMVRSLPYGAEADLWSLGVILFAMCAGHFPFSGRRMPDQIANGNYILPPFLSKECQSFISSFLCVNPANRMSLMDALDHPWMSAGEATPPSYLAKV